MSASEIITLPIERHSNNILYSLVMIFFPMQSIIKTAQNGFSSSILIITKSTTANKLIMGAEIQYYCI